MALALAPRPQHTREEIEAFKSTLKTANKDMTDAQFTVFMAAANHLGLDPLARQVVPILMSGRMTVQTTIDGFRLIAERTRKYRGQIGPFWCGPDGQWREVWLEDAAPAAAKVGVLRADFAEPMWGVARTKSYAKGGLWTAMPDVMIAKVAESIALRKTFPNELSGAYTAEELGQAIEADPHPQPSYAQPASAAPRRARPAATRAATTTFPEQTVIDETPPVAPHDLPKWGAMGAEAAALGLDADEWQATITAVTGKARKSHPTSGEVLSLAAQLTDEDKRAMLHWLEKRRQQSVDADAATPDLASLTYAGN